MKGKLLFVDDELNILTAYRRQLRKEYDITTALGGQEGLKVIEHGGPFAVVVSDLRMPDMSGIQFLAQVKEQSPDSVRVMITGFADLENAMAAVITSARFGRILPLLSITRPTVTGISSWLNDSISWRTPSS